MADIKTRIKLRTIEFSDIPTINNKKPLEGEVIVVKVPETAKSVMENGKTVTLTTPPTTLIKVGAKDENGNLLPFSELPWLSALAADVPSWAKQTIIQHFQAVDAHLADTVVWMGNETDATETDKTYYGLCKKIEKDIQAKIDKLISDWLQDETADDVISHLNEVVDWLTNDSIGAAQILSRLDDLEDTVNNTLRPTVTNSCMKYSDLPNYQQLATINETDVSYIKKIPDLGNQAMTANGQANSNKQTLDALRPEVVRVRNNKLCTVAGTNASNEVVTYLILDGGCATDEWD